jgi:uncharacterized protein (TIGR03437 family)
VASLAETLAGQARLPVGVAVLRKGLALALGFSSLLAAQSGNSVTITSAANATAGLAAESLATARGTGLASQTAAAMSLPFPTSLGGVRIQVVDSQFVSRDAGLIFVSPTQINFEIPAETATGPATVRIDNGGPPIPVPVQIQKIAPALFSLNDLGVAAATAVQVVIPTEIQSPVPVFQCFGTAASCRLVPIALGIDTPVYLSFYGTGIRGRASVLTVRVRIGNVDIMAMYAGQQTQFPGLDQVNVPLPLALRGAGDVNVTVTVDGVASNVVKINIL